MDPNLTLHLLRFLPKNLLSRAFGWLASRNRPRFLARALQRWFVNRFRLDLREAEHPIEHYQNLLALFTRALEPDARPLDPDPRSLLSPVDGRIARTGDIVDGTMIQAKGIDFDAQGLLGDAAWAARFAHGCFATLYLSPRDYHRIHAPCSGTLVETRYEPGTLWPVNPPAVRQIPRLFAINERITSLIETDRGAIAVVMVGATNVGSIRLAYDDFVTNRGSPRKSWRPPQPLTVQRGEHLATFQLGSTVVLLIEDRTLEWRSMEESSWIAFGSALGRFGDGALS